MSSSGNVKEKLREVVSDETFQDIEDFLIPRFDVITADASDVKSKRHWRIVVDGHGRWREIKSSLNTQPQERKSRTESGSKRESSSQNDKLTFSNNILNSARNSAKDTSLLYRNTPPPSSSFGRRDYRTLSTTMRSNVFPGVGNYNWHSQSNKVHTESALNLGDHRGNELRDEFYGITRDEMGAWNEASVHHERMKKSWEAYLEAIPKVGRAQIQIRDRNTEPIIQKTGPEPKTAKKQVKQLVSKKPKKQKINEEHDVKVNEEKVPVELPGPVPDDDDNFWDFYDQPFVKS